MWHVFASDPFGMAVSRIYANNTLGHALLLMRRIAHDRRMPWKVSHPDCPSKARGDCFACPHIPYESQCRNYKP